MGLTYQKAFKPESTKGFVSVKGKADGWLNELLLGRVSFEDYQRL
jgi:hypothetical protein